MEEVKIEFKPETFFTPNYLFVWGPGTFRIKDNVLKPLGFRWDSINRVWVFSSEKREDIVKKVKELEKHTNLNWVGKPLTLSPLYITTDLKDKEYVINTDKKTWDTIIDFAHEEGWREMKEVWEKTSYDMYASPDRKCYILKDYVDKKMYIMRDEEGLISKLMDAVINFIHEAVPRELGTTKVKVDVVYKTIEYAEIKARDSLTVTFKFDSFERSMHIENTGGVAILDMKEISSLIADFVAKNYKRV